MIGGSDLLTMSVENRVKKLIIFANDRVPDSLNHLIHNSTVTYASPHGKGSKSMSENYFLF